MPFLSPLRYPGGKRKLAEFVESLIDLNSIDGGTYVEPYAGGAAVALHLLLQTSVPRIIINDVDPCLYAFWRAVKDSPEHLCRRISSVSVDMSEWHRQRAVLLGTRPSRLDLAFATLFLNRTNRSGVLLAGVIGGQAQEGRWKVTARFNKRTLIERIEAIADRSERLEVRGNDAMELIKELNHQSASSVFGFLDPPYYHKADRRLYRDDYRPSDHETVAGQLRRVKLRWLLSYDDCAEIRRLYRGHRRVRFRISYTAGRKRAGSEVFFVSHDTAIPAFDRTARAWWPLPR